MPTKTTITNRKRSAEICPHPPHLLNKRYWEEAKAGKPRLPNKSVHQNICTKKEIPCNPLEKSRIETTSFIKKRFELPISTSKPTKNPLDVNFLTTSSSLSDNIALSKITKNIPKSTNYNQNNISPPTNIPPFIPPSLPFPFRFPINSKELQPPPSFEELMRTAHSQFNFQMFPPPQPTSFHFPPLPSPLHSGFFPENPMFQQGTSNGILHSFPLTFQQFPPFLNGKQNFNREESTALTQLMEIFNQNETTKESTSYGQQQDLNDYKQIKKINGSGREQKIESCTSDEQIDQMLDEMVQDREKITNKKQQLNSKNNKNLCILPLPIPIIVPVTSDFIFKYFSK
ncbi:hypothetical protein ACQ4LE_002787 [Meloidogyne hapla]|uniref:Uncharacterized protein n=1 Tax=Meloidogyne hapla TaxID=6305 RepID=A0A1I8B701_MELHA